MNVVIGQKVISRGLTYSAVQDLAGVFMNEKWFLHFIQCRKLKM